MSNSCDPVLFANALRTIAAGSSHQPTRAIHDLGFATLCGNLPQVIQALTHASPAGLSDTPGIEH